MEVMLQKFVSSVKLNFGCCLKQILEKPIGNDDEIRFQIQIVKDILKLYVSTQPGPKDTVWNLNAIIWQ